ncbi:MAG: heparin lyase I family protein [Gemmatimonadota bacterium]
MPRFSPVLVLLLLTPACDTPPLAQSCATPGGGNPAALTRQPGVWPHEPAGFTTVSDGIPGAAGDNGWKCDGDGVSLVSDQLVFTYRPGFRSGYAPGIAYLDVATPTPETYFGFWWKPSRPWQTHPSGVNKIALLFPSTSGGGTIYIMMFYDGGQYTIQVETTFDSDTRRLEPNITATPVALGEWHQIEWYVRYSSNPASRDGVVRWWLDGVQQGEYTDLQMPPDLGFTQYTIRPVWGGAEGDAKRQLDSFAYGRVHISKR